MSTFSLLSGLTNLKAKNGIKTQKIMRGVKTALLSSVIFTGGLSAHAGSFTWTNGTGSNDWTEEDNWNPDGLPGCVNQNKGDNVLINMSGEDKAVVGPDDHAKCYRVTVGKGDGVTGELKIAGGSVYAGGRHGKMTIGAGGGTGIIKQSGGSYYQKKKSVTIGRGNSSGVWKLSGGSVSISRGGINIHESGVMDISGGSVGASGVQIGNGGKFRVEGAADNGIGFSHEGWKQAAGGVLELEIEGNGITPITLGGDVAFADVFGLARLPERASSASASGSVTEFSSLAVFDVIRPTQAGLL